MIPFNISKKNRRNAEKMGMTGIRCVSFYNGYMATNKITAQDVLNENRFLFHADRIQRSRSLKQYAETEARIMNDEDLPEDKRGILLRIIQERSAHAIQLM